MPTVASTRSIKPNASRVYRNNSRCAERNNIVLGDSRPGTVKYAFTRNDGATGPTYAMEFKEAGKQAVSIDWTLGDAGALPHYVGWQAIKILSPNELKSDPALFELTCLKEVPPQNKGQSAVDKISSLLALGGKPAHLRRNSSARRSSSRAFTKTLC